MMLPMGGSGPRALYADNASATGGRHTITLHFGMQGEDFHTVLYIPPALAKQIAMILRQGLKKREEEFGEIKLLPADYTIMDIHPEDW